MPATPPEFRNLVELQSYAVETHGERPCFGTRRPSGEWVYATYAEVGELVDAFRGGLATLGVGPGDRVAVISNNRVEWAVGAYATYGLGACYVPMYEKQNPADWEYIVRDSGAKVLLVANASIADKTRPFIDSVEALEHVVDLSGPASEAHSYAGLIEAGREAPTPSRSPEPADLCGFIYTSGTTGNPKGVMLTHGNITSNVNAVKELFPMSPDDRSLSFLPWAHSFGQTCELHSGLVFGASAAIVDDVDKLIDYLSEVRPTLLFSVPRIFNRIYDGLNKRMAAGSPVKRALFEAGMANSSRRRALAAEGRTSFGVELKHRFFDKLVFSKVRDRLGGRLRYAFSGGAAISKEVAEFIDNVGITVYEGYGLSETSPIATANSPGHQRIGSVGKAIPGVEIRIDTAAVDHAMGDEGEVLIKGPNIMKGYHGLAEQTSAVLLEDGSFRTGDLGRLDADGFLYITGRIKEQYKLENGKYVVPAPLEERYKLSGYIDQIMVYGMNRPHNVAIIVPDVDALKGFASDNGLPADLEQLLDDAKVRELYVKELEQFGQAFKGFERARDFKLIAEPFSTDNDMLTPTLKLKRRNVIKAYQPVIDGLYT